MKGWTVVTGVALLILVSGSAGAQERHVAPGDSLVVEIRGHPELSGRFQVNSFGDLLIPRGGVVPVAGLVPSVVAQRISGVYRPYFGNLSIFVTRPKPVEPPQEPTPRVEPTAPPRDSADVARQETCREVFPVDTLAVPDSLPPTTDSTWLVPEIAPAVTTEPIPAPTTAPVDTVVSRPDTAAMPVVIQPDSLVDPESVPVRVAAPGEVAAKELSRSSVPAEAVRELIPPIESNWDLGLAAVGGVASTTSSHGYGGILATAGWQRVGIMGLGQYGSGGGYSSLLFSGGVTYEMYRLGPFSVLGTGGYSYYSEQGETGLERSVPAVMAGGIARVRIGRLRPSVALTGFFGSHEGDDLIDSFSVNFLRISFGLGF